VVDAHEVRQPSTRTTSGSAYALSPTTMFLPGRNSKKRAVRLCQCYELRKGRTGPIMQDGVTDET
jgi:hypothetical protein